VHYLCFNILDAQQTTTEADEWETHKKTRKSSSQQASPGNRVSPSSAITTTWSSASATTTSSNQAVSDASSGSASPAAKRLDEPLQTESAAEPSEVPSAAKLNGLITDRRTLGSVESDAFVVAHTHGEQLLDFGDTQQCNMSVNMAESVQQEQNQAPNQADSLIFSSIFSNDNGEFSKFCPYFHI
jgi:hypothetical protein